MTSEERRALGFIALLIALAAAARLRGPEPVSLTASEVDVDSLHRASGEARAAAERRARPLADGERIDPNTASAAELDRLPGVGPVLARRLVQHRDSAGRFASLADLDRVPGVGPSTLSRMAPYLRFPP